MTHVEATPLHLANNHYHFVIASALCDRVRNFDYSCETGLLGEEEYHFHVRNDYCLVGRD